MAYNTTDDYIRFVVRRLFHDILGREPAPQDLESFLHRWKDVGGDVVLADIYDSPEAEAIRLNKARYLVRKTYQEILGREPDPGGLNARGVQVKTGHVEEMLTEVYDSPEAEGLRLDAARYFVRKIYQEILERDPEDHALIARGEQVKTGHSEAMFVEVYDSREAEGLRVDRAQFEVRKLIRDYLYREIDDETELEKWVTMWRGRGRDATLRSILDSPEGKACTAAARKNLRLSS